MKKILLTLIMILALSPLAATTRINSGIETSTFYHPSFDLSGNDELFMRSARGTRITLIPVGFYIYEFEFSLNTSLLLVSPSITYNNTRNRAYNGIDIGLGLDFPINNNLSTKVNVALGALELGEADQEEAYFLASITPSLDIFKKGATQFSLTLPLNIIYRKQLLATTIGLGIKIDFDWIEQK